MEKILNFKLNEEVGVLSINESEYSLIDGVSEKLLIKKSDYQDIVSSVCTELSEHDSKNDNNIDDLYDRYCEIIYDLGMVPIEVSIFKGFEDVVVKNKINLDKIKDNRDYIIKGVVNIYKKYQETNEMSIASDIDKIIYPILSK